MPIPRILEAEVMDSPDDAADYDSMDHREVNQRFVTDLLATLASSEFKVQSSKLGDPPPTLNIELGTLNLDILDLGTGTAQIPIELCRRHADCRVMAADAAVSMLELARYNLEIENLTHRIELAHVDAKRLPFRDGMFDVVMSNSIVHHIPEPIDVIREAIRVANSGGLLFFRDLLRPETEGRLGHLVATYTAGANDHQQRMFAESLHAALALDEIRALIVSLGFAGDGVQQTSDRHWTWSAVR